MLRAMESRHDELMPIGRFSRLTGLTVRRSATTTSSGCCGRPRSTRTPATARTRPEQVERAETIRHAAAARGSARRHRRRCSRATIRRRMKRRARRPPAADGDPAVGAEARSSRAATADRRKGVGDGNAGGDARRGDAPQLGVDLFNKTWTLMEKDDRTREEDDEMIHCAHASAYHWLQVGTRGEPRAQRMAVLARAHHPRPRRAGAPSRAALPRARRGERRTEHGGLGSAGAYEALARAHMVAGDVEAETRRVRRARPRRRRRRSPTRTTARSLEADFATIAHVSTLQGAVRPYRMVESKIAETTRPSG